MWNPRLTVEALANIDGLSRATSIGVDGMSPGMAQLFQTLAPNAELVDGEQLMRGVRAAEASRRGRLHPGCARDRGGRDDGGHRRARPRCHRGRAEGALRRSDGALRHHAPRVRRHLLRDAARRRRRGHVATAAPDRATVAAGIGRSRRLLAPACSTPVTKAPRPVRGCAQARRRARRLRTPHCSTGGATRSTR